MFYKSNLFDRQGVLSKGHIITKPLLRLLRILAP